MSVATSAARSFSGSVEPARLIASTSTISAVISRPVLSFRSLLLRARYSAFTAGIAGRAFAASSANADRLIAPSASGPTASMNACSAKPADCAMIAFGA